MTYSQPGRAARGGFTLTELLVVILIIALLVSLTAAGVLKIMGQGPQLRTTNDITQLALGIQQFQNETGVNYIPSYFLLREDNEWNLSNPAEANCVNYLRRVFGKNINLTPVSKGGTGIDWNANGTIDSSKLGPTVLEGEHCLVFFLGGIQSSSSGVNAVLGFSTNPQNPALVGGTRRGPFYQNFESARLVVDTNGYFKYLDAWPARTPTTPRQPYAYFSAYGVQNGYGNSWGLQDQKFRMLPQLGDCGSLGLAPYQAGALFANPNTFQIVSAGKDNTFGKGGAWQPGGGGNPADTAGNDNQSNFAKGILEAGQ